MKQTKAKKHTETRCADMTLENWIDDFPLYGNANPMDYTVNSSSLRGAIQEYRMSKEFD